MLKNNKRKMKEVTSIFCYKLSHCEQSNSIMCLNISRIIRSSSEIRERYTEQLNTLGMLLGYSLDNVNNRSVFFCDSVFPFIICMYIIYIQYIHYIWYIFIIYNIFNICSYTIYTHIYSIYIVYTYTYIFIYIHYSIHYICNSI